MTGITRPRQQMVSLASAENRGLRWPRYKGAGGAQGLSPGGADLFLGGAFWGLGVCLGEMSCYGDAFWLASSLAVCHLSSLCTDLFPREGREEGSFGRRGKSGG